MTQTYDYKGVVEEVGKTQTFSSGFTKRDIIVGNDVDSNSKYPNPVKFTFKKEGCARLDHIRKGQRVEIQFAINGRKWDGPKGTQYFVDLTGLHIQTVGEHGNGTADVNIPLTATPPEVQTQTDEAIDDMPF